MNVISGGTGLEFQGPENFSQSASYWDPTWTHFALNVLTGLYNIILFCI